MSALPPKADKRQMSQYVCFVPIASLRIAANIRQSKSAIGNHTQSFCSRYGSPNTCGQAVGFDGLLLVAHRRHRQLSYIGDAAQSRQIENRQRAFIGFDQAGAAGTPTALG